jgi:hypothetical protein
VHLSKHTEVIWKEETAKLLEGLETTESSPGSEHAPRLFPTPRTGIAAENDQRLKDLKKEYS